MIRTRRASPIPRFLDVAPEADALDLLGLLPEVCTPAQIESALQRHLDIVAAHPECDTPEADEVRLALHAAAAQLLDHGVRRQIIAGRVGSGARSLRLGEEIAGDEGTPTESLPERAFARPAEAANGYGTGRPRHEGQIEYRYSQSADPNAAVKKIVLAIVVCGVLVIALVVGLILLTPGSPGTGTAGATPTVNSSADVKSATAATGTLVDGGSPGTASPSQSEKPLPQAAKPAMAKSEYVDAALMIRDLRAASAKGKTDPAGALADFRKAVGTLADWWPRYDVGQRRAADDAVLEFLYVLTDKAEAAPAIAELGKRATLPPPEAGQLGAGAVWPATWATGALTRLSVERGMPRSLAAGVAQALNDALGAGRSTGTLSFEGGAEAILRRMPVRLVAPRSPQQNEQDSAAPRTSAEGMKRWADAVAAVGGDADEVERMLIDGLEQVLLNGPEPDADQASYEAVEVLATRIRWRAAGPARDRVLEWFNDPRISAADLRVLTGVLASKSNAEGVDASMQLSVNASPDDRAQLRLQYAKAWGLATTEQRDKAFEQWRGFARGGYFAPAGEDELSKVARVVVAVRINLAARRLWLGDSATCSRILTEVENIPGTIHAIGARPGAMQPPTPLPGPGPGAPPRGPSSAPGRGPGGGGGGGKIANQPAPIAPGGDGPWAEQYLRAERNIPVRLQRLVEAESLQLPLSKVDAAVLVEAACFASPGQVRSAAQRVVMKFGDDPSIVQALLDELPIAPKVQSVSDVMSRVAHAPLPKIGDPEWEVATRRAIVDRLLGLLAGQGPQAGIDQACNLIGESYTQMAGVDSGLPDESGADRCLRGAGALFKLWRVEGERLPPPERAPASLDQIDRRRRSRQQIASGPVQAFAGEEVSVAEMLAYMVCAERPAMGVRALTIMDDMAKQRREAGNIFDQMIVTEQAITRLWMLRFGEVAQ